MKKTVAVLILCALVLSGCADGSDKPAAADAPDASSEGAPATLVAEPVNIVVTEQTPETETPDEPPKPPPAYVSEVESAAPPQAAAPPAVAITAVNETVWATEAVNVRLGAGVNCERIGGLWAGDSVTRTGLTDNGWSRIEFEGRTAYVKSDYVTDVDPDAPAPESTAEAAQTPETTTAPAITEVNETVWAIEAVNVRLGAGENFERIGGLWAGDSVTRTGLTDNGWSRIEFEGRTAYVKSDYVTNVDPDAPEGEPEPETPPPDDEPLPETPPPEAEPEPETPPPEETITPPPAPEFTITTLSGEVSADNINASLNTLCKQIGARRVGANGNLRARQYIYNELVSLGFNEADGSLWKHDFYSTGDLYTENILCSIPSKTGSDAKIVAVSAHFDTVRDVEGAIDNGSGVAALLETCRIIKQSGVKFDFELRFCFLSAEEDGYKGAYEYIRRQGPNIKKHICNFNIDMAGYANSGAPKALVVSTKGDPATSNWNPAQPNIMSGSIVDAYYALDLSFERYYSPTNAGKHDSVAFWKNDVPTATLSWREIDYSRAYGNDLGIATPAYIHSSYDNLENLNVDSVVTTTRLIVSAVCALGERVANGGA